MFSSFGLIMLEFIIKMLYNNFQDKNSTRCILGVMYISYHTAFTIQALGIFLSLYKPTQMRTI